MEQAEQPPRRRRLSSQERRQEFLSRAIEFFADEGFDSSTRGLAKRLGVTQPLLYRYFPSKEGLIQEVYETVYVSRWKPEWDLLLADRSRSLRARLESFYHAYSDAIFQRDWMRIYLFAGLKGFDINRRYMALVRERILIRVAEEARVEAGLPASAVDEREIQLAWVIHGGVFYCGVRDMVYDDRLPEDRSVIISDTVETLLAGLAGIRASLCRPRG